jgi:hypothetical protein
VEHRELQEKESFTNDDSQNDESQEYWSKRKNQTSNLKNDLLNLDEDRKKKFESEELSDHPLVIDENMREPGDMEQRTNTDDETEERSFELDDLYREDSSIVDSDRDEASGATRNEDKSNAVLNLSETLLPPLSQQNCRVSAVEKYISLEDALELLDRPQEESKKSSRLIYQSLDKEKERQREGSGDDEEDELPEKLTGNEKPQRESENLPLHVFLSRKVQESKKRKQQQQMKRLKEEQERILLELQPTRRQRKCAVGKQGLLAEISSSDDEPSMPSKKSSDKPEYQERQRGKQKQRESKEKRKERYIEKKHEQMIAKEQKAIEEAIMRELEEKRQSAASEASSSERDEKKQTSIKSAVDSRREESSTKLNDKPSTRKYWLKPKQESVEGSRKPKRSKSSTRMDSDSEVDERLTRTPVPTYRKRKPAAKVTQKTKKAQTEVPMKQSRSKSRPASLNRGKDFKEPQQPRSLSSRRESDLEGDEELKAARSWNKVDEGVGVAIGRRKRAAANQLYYWSSSSEEEEEEEEELERDHEHEHEHEHEQEREQEQEQEQEKEQFSEAVASAITVSTAAAMAATAMAVTATTTVTTASALEVVATVEVGQESQEDDRQEQHGWIVGDSHKKMITMLAMEKQMKEKRRRSENDEQPPGSSQNTKIKNNKKHRNSTS